MKRFSGDTLWGQSGEAGLSTGSRRAQLPTSRFVLEVCRKDGKLYPSSTLHQLCCGILLLLLCLGILHYLAHWLHRCVMGPEQTVCSCLKVPTAHRVALHNHWFYVTLACECPLLMTVLPLSLKFEFFVVILYICISYEAHHISWEQFPVKYSEPNQLTIFTPVEYIHPSWIWWATCKSAHHIQLASNSQLNM